MLRRHHAFAAALVALAAAAGLSTTAEAGPCVPGTGSNADNNTCIGTAALSSNTTGVFNAAIGVQALNRNTTGSLNTASGAGALQNNTGGSGNTASGASALTRNTSGSFNTASGISALFSNTTGGNNAASGASALYSNTTGTLNTASGVSSLYSNQTGSNNTASGGYALYANTTGSGNTANGYNALLYNTTGSNNIALGFQAGLSLTTGSNNIVIGNTGTAADLNTIRVGAQGTQTRTFIAGIRGTMVTGGQSVVVNADGQLGVTSSSRRYKDDIQPMGEASSPLMQLRPVTFRYKDADADGSKPLQYGLIAEEVEQAMPGLVIYNKDGTPESVAYQVLPSLLLNEYQKQNRELAAAKAELAETRTKFEAMQAEMAALKLVVSRLAAAPSAIKLADSQP